MPVVSVLRTFAMLLILTQSNLLFAQQKPSAIELQIKSASRIQKGISASVIWELKQQKRLRLNASHYSDGSQQHLINLVAFTEKKRRTDVALLFDYKLSKRAWSDRGWFATAGIVHLGKGSQWDAFPEPKASYSLNGRLYAGIHLEEPKGRIEYSSVSPYLGLGWHSKIKKGWQISAEAGVAFATDPRFVIDSNNPFQLPTLTEDLQAEADKYIREIAKDLEILKDKHLHIGLTVSYRF